MHSYDKAIQRVNRKMGTVPVQALTPLQIEKFYASSCAVAVCAANRKTVRNSYVVLRKALAGAERLGLVYRNAAASARPPTAARPEFNTWSLDDLREFFATVRDDRLYSVLLELRRRNRVLEMELEILKRAAAYFAKANVLPN